MTQKLFLFLLITYLLGGIISFLFLRKVKQGKLLWSLMMTGIIIWEVIQYRFTFGKTSGIFKDVEARWGMIGVMFWGVGGMLLISVLCRFFLVREK